MASTAAHAAAPCAAASAAARRMACTLLEHTQITVSRGLEAIAEWPKWRGPGQAMLAIAARGYHHPLVFITFAGMLTLLATDGVPGLQVRPCSMRRCLRCCVACMLHGMLWAHKEAAPAGTPNSLPCSPELPADLHGWCDVARGGPAPWLLHREHRRHAVQARCLPVYFVCPAMPPSLHHSCHLNVTAATWFDWTRVQQPTQPTSAPTGGQTGASPGPACGPGGLSWLPVNMVVVNSS